MTPRRRWFRLFLGFSIISLVSTIGGVSILLAVSQVLELLGIGRSTASSILVVLGSLICLAIPAAGVIYASVEWLDQRDAWRAARGCCTHCGYSLRGVRLSARKCPECGAPFKSIHRVEE